MEVQMKIYDKIASVGKYSIFGFFISMFPGLYALDGSKNIIIQISFYVFILCFILMSVSFVILVIIEISQFFRSNL